MRTPPRSLLIVLLVSFGCSTTAGPVARTDTSPELPVPSPSADAIVATASPTPAPTATPRPAERLTFSGRDGSMVVEISVTPAKPTIGERVTFDFLMRYEGTGHERDAMFAVDHYIEGSSGVHTRPDCPEPDPKAPANVRRTEKRFRETETFSYPGPYEVVFSASGACIGDDKPADANGEVTVVGEPDLPAGEVLLPHLEAEASTLVGTTDISIEADPRGPCVWATDPQGHRSATLWPIGYRARFDPLRIYDEEDREVWREGVPRDSPGQPGGRIARVPERCRVGDRIFTMD